MEVVLFATHVTSPVLTLLSSETGVPNVPLRKKLNLKPMPELKLDGKLAITMVTPTTRTHFFIKYRISKERTALWSRKTVMSAATHPGLILNREKANGTPVAPICF